jgi:hypothetical protein
MPLPCFSRGGPSRLSMTNQLTRSCAEFAAGGSGQVEILGGCLVHRPASDVKNNHVFIADGKQHPKAADPLPKERLANRFLDEVIFGCQCEPLSMNRLRFECRFEAVQPFGRRIGGVLRSEQKVATKIVFGSLGNHHANGHSLPDFPASRRISAKASASGWTCPAAASSRPWRIPAKASCRSSRSHFSARINTSSRLP